MPNWRDQVPRGHPLNQTLRETDVKRTRDDLDEIFEFGSSPLERDDVEVTRGPEVQPSGYLDDEEFESYTEQARESDRLGWDSRSKTNFVRTEELSTPDPLGVHMGRGQETAQMDTQRKAKVTTDPEKYAEDPGRYDYPFVDTPSEFREEYGNKSWSFFERKAGEDDVFEW